MFFQRVIRETDVICNQGYQFEYSYVLRAVYLNMKEQ